MGHESRNIGASVRARLLDRARGEKTDFQILLTRYALERLLYRLSVSDQRARFVLKGAMLFAIWQDDPFRPTRDLDLLGYGDPDPAMVAASIRAPVGLSDTFALQRDAQWRTFLARDRLAAAPASLVQVTKDLHAFLRPVLAQEGVALWPPGGPWTHVEAAS